MNPAQIANLERTLAAFIALVAKLEMVGQDPEFRHVFTLSAIHGYRYSGPTWETELAQAQACLREARAMAASPEPPEGEVPWGSISEGTARTGAGDGTQDVRGRV